MTSPFRPAVVVFVLLTLITGLIYPLVVAGIARPIRRGLMGGRTPEYLGNEISVPEMKLIVPYAVVAPMVILPLTAVSRCAFWSGWSDDQCRAHGLSEILVAFVTSAANNGQNLAGLSANSPFYNITAAIAMWGGTIWPRALGPCPGGHIRTARSQAGHAGYDAHRHIAVCLVGRWHSTHHWRAQLLPGAGPRGRSSSIFSYSLEALRRGGARAGRMYNRHDHGLPHGPRSSPMGAKRSHALQRR